MNELQEKSFFNWRINTTFLSLILKIDYHTHVGGLAIRLVKVMHGLISYHKGAAVKGRNILEEILIANELIDLRSRSKEPGHLCKVDNQRTFDCMSWGWIDYLIYRMGLGLRWRCWITVCISTTPFSVVINGSGYDFFPDIRGIRLGDP